MADRPIYGFTKFPHETFQQAVQFSASLGLTETIVSGTATAVDRDSGEDVTTAIIDGAASVNGTTVQYEVKGGTVGARYMLSITATTNTGNVYEQWVEMRIPQEIL